MSERAGLGRRELNKIQTRQRLMDAARSLLAEAGAGVRIEEIADRAEVSRATFFNYFATKEDLFTELYQVHMEHLAELVDRLLADDVTTSERIVRVFADFLRSLHALPGYLVTVTAELERTTNPELTRYRSQLFSDQVARILDRGVADGEIRSDHSVEFLSQMVAAVYVSTIRHGIDDPREVFDETFLRAAGFAAEFVAAR